MTSSTMTMRVWEEATKASGERESPGNIISTYPFQVIAMDHIPSLPISYKGNTELLVWVDLFTGFVIAKANTSRSAQTVAEAYEEAVFRRFGASEAIRHDRESGFMADFFKAFNKRMGKRQQATLVYRPLANGAAERMVPTVTRAVKMYIADVDQSDWAIRLVTAGTPYQLSPIVHISKLKPVREFPTRSAMQLTVPADGRFDFDEELLAGDSEDAQDLEDGVFEVEKILDVREGRATRYGCTRPEFEVQWKGYPDSTWVAETDLNCGGLLDDFLRRRTGRNRFEVMQSHEDAVDGSVSDGGRA
ncbi:unnamed protein product [Phytophthora fragariaefolia]|uniref:Unnamed protein product n=1 Tax=Phytophthora fragariaefolia TaxID=1490495 RepID=A0A9W7CUC7_9STRA|nr:unnamed protein product [Phytophthora fragariaefolia]